VRGAGAAALEPGHWPDFGVMHWHLIEPRAFNIIASRT
jgi:hypothetical protein